MKRFLAGLIVGGALILAGMKTVKQAPLQTPLVLQDPKSGKVIALWIVEARGETILAITDKKGKPLTIWAKDLLTPQPDLPTIKGWMDNGSR